MGHQDGYGRRYTARQPDGYTDSDGAKEWRLPRHTPAVEEQREFVRQCAERYGIERKLTAEEVEMLVAMLGCQDVKAEPVDLGRARPRRRYGARVARRLRMEDTSALGEAA